MNISCKFGTMRKHFIPISAIFLLMYVQTSAQDLSTLIPDSVAGPVTQVEIDRYDDYYPHFEIPRNNDEKEMTWDLSPFINSLIYMYEITRDTKYIDYAIKCCDKVPVEKTEAVTTLCRTIATNVKPIVLRHLDGQLKSAWNSHCVRFFQCGIKRIPDDR